MNSNNLNIIDFIQSNFFKNIFSLIEEISVWAAVAIVISLINIWSPEFFFLILSSTYYILSPLRWNRWVFYLFLSVLFWKIPYNQFFNIKKALFVGIVFLFLMLYYLIILLKLYKQNTEKFWKRFKKIETFLSIIMLFRLIIFNALFWSFLTLLISTLWVIILRYFSFTFDISALIDKITVMGVILGIFQYYYTIREEKVSTRLTLFINNIFKMAGDKISFERYKKFLEKEKNPSYLNHKLINFINNVFEEREKLRMIKEIYKFTRSDFKKINFYIYQIFPSTISEIIYFRSLEEKIRNEKNDELKEYYEKSIDSFLLNIKNDIRNYIQEKNFKEISELILEGITLFEDIRAQIILSIEFSENKEYIIDEKINMLFYDIFDLIFWTSILGKLPEELGEEYEKIC